MNEFEQQIEEVKNAEQRRIEERLEKFRQLLTPHLPKGVKWDLSASNPDWAIVGLTSYKNKKLVIVFKPGWRTAQAFDFVIDLVVAKSPFSDSCDVIGTTSFHRDNLSEEKILKAIAVLIKER